MSTHHADAANHVEPPSASLSPEFVFKFMFFF
jgi:hypothetical protein